MATINDSFDEKYVSELNSMVESIKKLEWGDQIRFNMENIIGTTGWATVCKNTDIESFIFKGKGCKNLLKYFITQTQDDTTYGYLRFVQILDQNGYRQFVPIKNWEQFWEKYKTEPIKTRSLFEVIQSDLPCKPYLDIEWKTDTNAREIDNSFFISQLISDLIYIFNYRYNIVIEPQHILLTESHSEHKVSFHVVIDKTDTNGATLGYVTNRKHTQNSAWDLYVALMEKNKALYEKKIDESVYTLDREFRAIYSNKAKEFRPTIPLGEKINELSKITMNDDECFKYLITYSKHNKYVALRTPLLSTEDLHKTILSRYRLTNPAKPLIKSCSNPQIKRYLELAKDIHPTAYFTGDSPNGGCRFSYLDKTEPCYTGKFHDSNGFYIVESPEGTIKMICLSENCKKTKILHKTEKKKTKKNLSKILF